MSALALGLLATAGCGPTCADGFGENADGACVPYVQPDDTGEPATDDTGLPTDSGTTPDTDPPLSLVWGDPILPLGGDEMAFDEGWEFVDAVALDDQQALAAGQGGYAIVELATGTHTLVKAFQRVYDLAWDAELERAYLGTRTYRVEVLDLADRGNPAPGGSFSDWEGVHEDLAASAGRVLVAAPETGALLYDGRSLSLLSVLPGDWIAAVGLHQDRAIVGDSNQIVLYDLGDPYQPVELDRVSLRASARDVVFDGVTVGVALGGYGAAVLRVSDDTLSLAAELDLPGSSYGVALDDQSLWVSSWSDVSLIWLGEGGPVTVGTEPVRSSTLGLAAAGGRALAADWFGTSAYEQVPGLAGPELDVPTLLYTAETPGEIPQASLLVANLGALPLSVSATVRDSWATLSEAAFTVAAGATTRLSVTGTTDRPLNTLVTLTTDDPDEETTEIELRNGQQSVGQPHDDFTVQGYVYPDPNLAPYSLGGPTGRVTFLAYFALY